VHRRTGASGNRATADGTREYYFTPSVSQFARIASAWLDARVGHRRHRGPDRPAHRHQRTVTVGWSIRWRDRQHV